MQQLKLQFLNGFVSPNCATVDVLDSYMQTDIHQKYINVLVSCNSIISFDLESSNFDQRRGRERERKKVLAFSN